MAIIYSYPVVTPTADDYVLGTDATAADKPTKNFTIQSIVDIVSGGAAGLGAVLAISSDASDPTTGVNQSASNFLNVQGTGTFTAATFLDGTMSIAGGIGTGFSSITSTDFVGNLTGIVQAGSSIAGLAGGTDAQNVLGVTQNVGDNSTRLATTAYVMAKVDPSVLTFVGTTGGNQTVNLVTQALSLLGTTSEIKTVSSAQTLTISLADGAFGSGTELILPDGASATTQAATDNSTLVATTAFVNTEDDAQDLDFTGDTGTSSVLLNSQTLDFEGTALQVTTAVTAQKVKFTLPTNVTIGGIFTGTTFSGDLLGTVNTATTGVTQAAGDNSTLIATTEYVDTAAGAKTLRYEGDATGPFTLNLTDDIFEFNGDSNITVTATTVSGVPSKGIVTIDLNNDVTILGTMQAGTLSDGTFSGTAGTYTGGVNIASTIFDGALQGNADSATALASTGNITLVGGESTSPAYLYTSGGAINIVTTLVNSAVTGKILTGLTVPTTGNSIEPADTILGAFGKLQAQHNTQVNGLRFMGAWDARTAAEGGLAGDKGNPQLDSGGGVVVTGTNTSVVADQLVDSTKNFTSLGVAIGERVYNQAGAFTTVSAVGTTTLTLDEDIFLTNGQTYSVDNNPAINQGEYYVVSNEGTVTLNTINTWKVGDWVMAGATNVWEKLDGPGVEGNGTINRIPRWDTVNSLNDSIILQSGTGITLDTGKHFATVGAGAITSAALLTASAALDLTGGITLPVGGYGTAGQVLTNIAVGTPAAGVDLVWTTPTEGTVEEVDSGAGLITSPVGGIIATGSVAIDYLGANNAILSATDLASGTIALTDQIWFNDINTGTVTNTLSYAPVSKLKDIINTYTWDVNVDGGTASTVTDGLEVDFLSGTGITQSLSTRDVTTAIRYEDENANPATGAKNFIDETATVAPVATDFLAFSDQFNTATKNVVKKATIADIVDLGNETLSEVLSNGNTTGATKISVNNSSSGVDLIDDTKIRFGDIAGTPDLEIYHTAGANSIIKATVTSPTAGPLLIQSDNLELQASSVSEKFLTTSVNAELNLFYNNVKKFETTATGVTVSGALTATAAGTAGIFNSGATNVVASFTSTDALAVIQFVDNTGNVEIGASGDCFVVQPAGGTAQLTVCTTSSTFAGDLTVDGDLTVGGSIIHGGGGVFSGDQAIITASASLAFTLNRATTGALIFDVWLTSETSTGTSVTKKYTVAHSYNATPVYNKIIDTGLVGSNDFLVTFLNAAAGLSVTCNIQAVGVAQNIGYTVQVGHDSTNALTFTAAS